MGIACTGHGASIALVTADGIVRSSVLDRWAGVKHVLLLSKNEEEAIRNPDNEIDRQINYLFNYGYGKFPPTLIFEEIIADWTNWLLRGLNMTASDVDLLVTSESHFATCRARLGSRLNQWFPNAYVSSGIEHHQIHQRQAFWQSGFEEAAVLTLDACGEPLARLDGRTLAGTISEMEAGGRCRTLKNIFFPESSPGLLYEVVTRHVGFYLGDEGKTMGLAPYGNDELFRRIEPLLDLHSDGGFAFVPHLDFERILTEYAPPREPHEEITQRHRNIAYAGQALLERTVQNGFCAALRLTGRRKLAYAGGVALNSVANEIAFRAASPEALYVSPNPGDTGHALGCALFGAYEIAGWTPILRELPEFIGPSYSNEELMNTVRMFNFPTSEPSNLPSVVAQCLANGYIVARFSEGAEFGPRALGNRSVLCDPRFGAMKDYLNERVKHREGFRPFAPAVIMEFAHECFEMVGPSRFMLRVVAVRPEYRDLIPATVHVDGSCRVQTVAKTENPGFYDLLFAFKQITGIPVLLNTSFNIGGKPIVESPRDALQCFADSAIDILALGGIIVSKRPLTEYQDSRAIHA